MSDDLELEINGLAGHLCHLSCPKMPSGLLGSGKIRLRSSLDDLKLLIEEPKAVSDPLSGVGLAFSRVEERVGIPSEEMRLFQEQRELLKLRDLSERELTLVRRTPQQVHWLQAQEI